MERGVVCWTLDIDPAEARWAAPGHHIVGPIEQVASRLDPAMFDTVVLSGVFGLGVNDVAAQDSAIAACAAILKPGGLLVLGWNTDRVSDPSTLHSLEQNFEPSEDAGFVGRVTFDRCTHVFDFHTRREMADTTPPARST